MSYFTFLRTFIAVYRCGSYNKASKKLGLSQPAISKQISALEQQLGKQLFKRNGRGLETTLIADDLASALTHHIDSIEIIFNQSRVLSDDMAGTVHIGGPKEFINAKMIPTFASLSQHDIKVVLQVQNPNKIYGLIDDSLLDFAITEKINEKRDIGYCPLFASDLVLVSSPQWAKQLSQKTITPESLSSIPLLVYEEAFNYIKKYYAEVFKQDSVTHPLIAVEDLSIIHSLLCENAGYSVIPRYLVEEDLASGNLQQLLHPAKPPQYMLYFLWNKIAMRKKRNCLVRDAILKAAEGW